jgi:predicted nucleic acid-binding protein
MREERIAEELAELCPLLPMAEACWSEAESLGGAAKLGGLTCPMADVLIVACARRHGAEIGHDDKHIEVLLKL